MSDPLISVIIPTYRHRDFILRTLDSVFAQTRGDYEIIVVNDGSPDDTKTVLTPLVDAGRIRYVEQPNGGQSQARNRGLELARGKYIAFLDDDDLWPPDKLEWQTEEC
jgi:glycosyltransferase involved in cell wall biosynthesis